MRIFAILVVLSMAVLVVTEDVLTFVLEGEVVTVVQPKPPKLWNNYALTLNKKINSVNSTYNVDSQCKCRVICFTSPKCFQVSAVEVSGQIQCQVSYTPHTYGSLVDSPGDVTFHWFHVYQKQGGRYYLKKEKATWFQAVGNCNAEGGHLAVMDTDDKRKEVEQFLAANGNPTIWIGLFAVDPKTSDNPVWYFSEDHSIPSTVTHTGKKIRCYSRLNNGKFDTLHACSFEHPYLCQRDH